VKIYNIPENRNEQLPATLKEKPILNIDGSDIVTMHRIQERSTAQTPILTFLKMESKPFLRNQ